MSGLKTVAVDAIPGTWVIDVPVMRDDRGTFVKTFQTSWLENLGCKFELREEFFSESAAGVLRGMHFQTPPADHQKIVSCTAGRVLDVLLDLRRGENYGRSWSIELDADQPRMMLIPRGVAHGFLSLQTGSVMVYKTDHEYAPEFDAGIAHDSFGFDWPPVDGGPRMSDRDQQHPNLSDWETPF